MVQGLDKMKQMEGTSYGKVKQASPPPPPPLPPLPRFWVVTKPASESVTNQEIARFWKQRRMVEEDHLLAAIKAVARIRARNLTEEDYKRFEDSLKDEDCESKQDTVTIDYNRELRVGIKDWWTKSKYAYLNQPATRAMDTPKKRTSTYIPNYFFYKPTPPRHSSLGVF